jgi:hypothetical protein
MRNVKIKHCFIKTLLSSGMSIYSNNPFLALPIGDITDSKSVLASLTCTRTNYNYENCFQKANNSFFLSKN